METLQCVTGSEVKELNMHNLGWQKFAENTWKLSICLTLMTAFFATNFKKMFTDMRQEDKVLEGYLINVLAVKGMGVKWPTGFIICILSFHKSKNLLFEQEYEHIVVKKHMCDERDWIDYFALEIMEPTHKK